MHPYLALSLAIGCEVAATTLLARSEGFTRAAPTALCLAGYGLSFFFLSRALLVIPTGVAYAIWSAVGVVLVSTLAWLFAGQKLDAPAIFGMALIVAGVVVIHAFSKSAAH